MGYVTRRTEWRPLQGTGSQPGRSVRRLLAARCRRLGPEVPFVAIEPPPLRDGDATNDYAARQGTEHVFLLEFASAIPPRILQTADNRARTPVEALDDICARRRELLEVSTR